MDGESVQKRLYVPDRGGHQSGSRGAGGPGDVGCDEAIPRRQQRMTGRWGLDRQHVDGGTSASIARATRMPVSNQPSQFVRGMPKKNGVPITRANNEACDKSGTDHTQCVVFTIAGSIDTSHAVRTRPPTSDHHHFDAWSSFGARTRPQIASDATSM